MDININRYFGAFGIALLLEVCMFCPETKAQQTDPTLTAAVVAQTAELKSVYKQRKKIQDQILAAQGTIMTAMNYLQDVEKKTLEYLGNASVAVQNMYQIKKSAELMIEIPKQCKELTDAVPDNLKGTAVSLAVSKHITGVTVDVAELYALIARLVTSTDYSFSDSSSDNGKKHVNLLSAAERTYIANTVYGKLNGIHRGLYILTWQVKYLTVHDLLWGIDAKSMARLASGERIAKRVLNDWNRLTK